MPSVYLRENISRQPVVFHFLESMFQKHLPVG